jgi:hypothetical protein
MGYCTRYTLTAVPPSLAPTDPLVTVLGEKPRALPDFVAEVVALEDYDPFEDSCKWYDHEDHMITISKRHPTILFVLDGFGEEDGDIWRKYFRAGKKYRSETKISFTLPPESMLSKVDQTQIPPAPASRR